MIVDRAEAARFQRQVKVLPAGCWLWTGQGTGDGYGFFRPGPGRPRVMAHRYAYERFVGPIPDGAQLDHRCHTDTPDCPGGKECGHRRCVNPEHLEPVSASENTLRQRHYERARSQCPAGHPYTGDNLIMRADGKRRCRECDRARKRAQPTVAGK